MLVAQEFKLVGTVATATRYYTHGGTTICTRTAAGLNWIVGDHHGTAEVIVKASDLTTVAKRRTTPYGQIRGTTSGTWPTGMDKGFVGGTIDPSELIHLGAREYDPFTGRFASVDPVLDTKDPQQMHGYAYSHNSPVTQSDPSGLYDCGDLNCNQYSYETSSGTVVGGTPVNETAPCAPRCDPKKDLPKPKPKNDKKDCGFWSFACNAWDATKSGLKTALDATSDWVSSNWSTISTGLLVAGLAVCVLASAGACAVVAGVTLAANFLNKYSNAGHDVRNFTAADWWNLGVDAVLVAVGAGYGRVLAGSARTFWTGTPAVYNAAVNASRYSRTELMSRHIPNVIARNARAIEFTPEIRYAVAQATYRINHFDPYSSTLMMAVNLDAWAMTNRPGGMPWS